jgi:hypothetical protein
VEFLSQTAALRIMKVTTPDAHGLYVYTVLTVSNMFPHDILTTIRTLTSTLQVYKKLYRTAFNALCCVRSVMTPSNIGQ